MSKHDNVAYFLTDLKSLYFYFSLLLFYGVHFFFDKVHSTQAV